ncbi:histidinol-phosphate transaminase [Actinomadura verrucosospora]|uniref:Aromatic amino acid aminotransferase n=1 Tax=Actinomadura verrucosospora TaxID=46165 RepID=A0A7D4A5Y6_ACTVE|nr:histidinol-phosphate transaminase [Actinomadura verrucosospora]QKG23405.1 histidinol-phosphate aminotransferase [Actinomadura verrucosospora]
MSEATTPRFRSVLDRFVAYKPGKVVVSPEGRSFKLSSNESPEGPLPSVLDAIAAAARNVNRYPDNNATALTEAIAGFCGVPADQVAVGCGSVGMTQMLLEAVAEPGTEVVYAWRSFEAYPLLVSLSGATGVQVALKDETHDLPAMADAITEKTRLVFLCNPNNPTGTVVGRAEIEAFLDRVPEDCLVVLDEAYREYVRDDEVPDGLTLVGDRPNLAVLRTFSKAYGLAGLRIGYLVAHPVVAGAIRKTFLPFSVNSVAQAAGIASLEATDELLERVERTVKERDRVHGALRADGWTVPPTEANFVWLRLGDRTMEFSAACDAQGVSVRPFEGEGARVSIGSPEENDAFLEVAKAFPHRN